MEEGKKYLVVSAFGWGHVGVYKRTMGINDAVFADCHFVTKCGDNTDWGRFVRNGPGANALVNLLGEVTINLDHRLWSVEFKHELPKPR